MFSINDVIRIIIHSHKKKTRFQSKKSYIQDARYACEFK